MKYHVEVSDDVFRKLRKVPKNDRLKLIDKFDSMKDDPFVGKSLSKKQELELRELKYGSRRIYFTIENKFVVISAVKYQGSVGVRKIGNKNSQKRDINKLQKDFFRKR